MGKRNLFYLKQGLAIGLTALIVLVFQLPSTQSNQHQIYTNDSKSIQSEGLKFNSSALKSIAKKYSDVEQISGTELALHKKMVKDIIMNSELTEANRDQALKELGVQKIDNGIETKLASSTGNVSMYTPSLSYDSKTKEYIFTGYGLWKDTDYWNNDVKSDMLLWLQNPANWKVGKTKNIGGAEAVGIAITNPSGSTKGLYVTDGFGFLTSGTDVISSTMVTNDDNNGAAYEPQDKCTLTSFTNYLVAMTAEWEYNAHSFKTCVNYNSSLSNYNGNAKTFYIHNWNSCKISNINLGNSGVGVDLTKESKGWGPAYSTAKPF